MSTIFIFRPPWVWTRVRASVGFRWGIERSRNCSSSSPGVRSEVSMSNRRRIQDWANSLRNCSSTSSTSLSGTIW